MVSQVTSFSRNGVSDWLLQRATAWILTAYTIVLFGYIVSQPEITYQEWRALFSQTWMQVFTVIALLSTCAHAWIGLWTVGTDYIRSHLMGDGADTLRFIYQIVCISILVVYLVWGIQILWGN
ncbi:MAG: succinate dehydrogenase, hydrophobic membrane anchor protein [Pseudomonadales bacterium]